MGIAMSIRIKAAMPKRRCVPNIVGCVTVDCTGYGNWRIEGFREGKPNNSAGTVTWENNLAEVVVEDDRAGGYAFGRGTLDTHNQRFRADMFEQITTGIRSG